MEKKEIVFTYRTENWSHAIKKVRERERVKVLHFKIMKQQDYDQMLLPRNQWVSSMYENAIILLAYPSLKGRIP